MKPIEEPLLDRGRAGHGQPGEKTGIEAEGDRGDRREHGDTGSPADPFADAQGMFERREHASADQERQAK